MDTRVVDCLRCLCADVIQKADSGHPGAPMGLSPVAITLFTECLAFDPSAPQWHNRDRFVLSNGHASALLYSLLHLCGYPAMTMDQLKQFRQWGSITPGHPERGVTPGVEVTTGPLGQGIANAVGLAMAEAHLGATFNKPGFDVCRHHTYVVCGDGCLMEGVAQEALSMAGHLQLERLVVIYDDNDISIDGNVNVTYTEHKAAKYRALGFHTILVKDGDTDYRAIAQALQEARAHRGQPTMILLKTTIGFRAKLQGTGKVHGSPLGAAEIKRIKALVGRDPAKSFFVEQDVYGVFAAAGARGKAAHRDWREMMARYASAFPALAAQYQAFFATSESFVAPRALAQALPGNGASVATRKASENVLAVAMPVVANLVGGSADLTGSNLTRPDKARLVDFQPATYQGRYMRFGVREHAMVAMMNGIDAHGGLIAFGGTFLNFAGYAMGALRLSAMSHHGVIFVATHDSIGLGEDGPTHQPVEIMAALRATPNTLVLRPADQVETNAAWLIALESRRTPSVLCLSRQNTQPLTGASSVEGVRRGAYTVSEASDAGRPDVVLIGSGSEVALALAAKKLLVESGAAASVRVVSMPSWELFERQPVAYRRALLHAGAAIVSIEPFSGFGWSKYSHAHVGLKEWGGSAPAPVLYEKLGVTAGAMVAAAKEVLVKFGRGSAPAVMPMMAKL